MRQYAAVTAECQSNHLLHKMIAANLLCSIKSHPHNGHHCVKIALRQNSLVACQLTHVSKVSTRSMHCCFSRQPNLAIISVVLPSIDLWTPLLLLWLIFSSTTDVSRSHHNQPNHLPVIQGQDSSDCLSRCVYLALAHGI
jgi:hypothetical protein